MSNKTNKTNKTKLSFFGITKILPYLRPFWKDSVFILVMGFLSSANDVIVPLFQKYVLNEFVGERDFSTLGTFILLYVLAVIMSGTFNLLSTFRATKTETEICNNLRGKIFSHLQTMSFSYFNTFCS